MRYLGIDPGEKRIGLAYADDLGLATPLPAATETDAKKRLNHIATLVSERGIDALVVGYPLNMDGSVGFKAKEVDAFINELEQRTHLPVHRMDERLTSRVADEQARAGGKRAPRTIRERQAERASGQRDSRAATVILQDYLDAQTSPPLLPTDPDVEEQN